MTMALKLLGNSSIKLMKNVDRREEKPKKIKKPTRIEMEISEYYLREALQLLDKEMKQE
jgi:hypothetical protein